MSKENEEENSSDLPKRRKPTPKKAFSFDAFKKQFTGDLKLKDKELKWINLSNAFQTQVGIPGIPMGYTTLFRGYSNSGKSTALLEGIISAQKMGQFIIIVDTEKNLGLIHLTTMGFDEKGDNYIYVDNEFLLENYGKKKNPTFKQASIEDLAEFIHDILDQQENGSIPFDILFAIDSIGTLDCCRTISALEQNTGENNMFNAGALEKHFKSLLNNRIPSSRKENRQHFFTLACVQKIYYDNMNNVIKHRGGEAFFSGARNIIHFGNTLTHGTKKVVATSKGREVSFGVEVKCSIVKNQIDSFLGGLGFDGGKLVSTPHGFISADKDSIAEYKKEHILFFRNKLGLTDSDDIDVKSENLTQDEELDFLNND